MKTYEETKKKLMALYEEVKAEVKDKPEEKDTFHFFVAGYYYGSRSESIAKLNALLGITTHLAGKIELTESKKEK